MATVRQDNTRIWDSHSLDIFGGTHKKVTPCECRSQPFPKPNLNSSQDGEFNEKNKRLKVILLFKSSVCVGEEVSEAMKELERQWKRGLLPNLLPVLEFTMWSLIQPQHQEGSIPQLWLKSKQRFRHTAAMRHIPQSVWKWIREASVDIKLDPETSHPDLRLSADRKWVKMDTIIESKYGPRDGHRRSPHKYDGWWCVQGSEGFTEGRHYWEVGVRGKAEWRIGVVKESADRRGFMDLNTQSGYWTLRLQGGKLKALTVPATEIPLPQPPSRLGVHLDMEEGQLSFYDVERSCHIYTFNNDFDEKVYPLFGTVETDREIVILQESNRIIQQSGGKRLAWKDFILAKSCKVLSDD